MFLMRLGREEDTLICREKKKRHPEKMTIKGKGEDFPEINLKKRMPFHFL